MKVAVAGVPEALYAFAELPKRLRIKHVRIALSAAAGMIRNAAASIVQRKSKLLQRSLKVKVTIPDASYNEQHHGKPAYAVIGPVRRAVSEVVVGRVLKSGIIKTKRRVSVTGRNLLSGVRLKRASRYAHLVEKGHGGKQPARAFPFLSRAVEQVGAGAMAKAKSKLEEGLFAEAANLVSRSRIKG